MRSSLILLLLTSAAFAADLPNKNQPLSPSFAIRPATVMPVASSQMFEGFYAGAHAGLGFNGRFNDMTNSSVVNYGKGALGGFRAGYDKQHLDWVFGAFGEINLVGVRAKETLINGTVLNGKVNWTGTVVGRAGYLLSQNTLFYGIAGVNISGFTMDYALGNVTAHETNTALGWSVGAGAEYKFNTTWSAFGEYRNANHFEKKMSNFMGAKYDVNYHAVRFGVNYKY